MLPPQGNSVKEGPPTVWKTLVQAAQAGILGKASPLINIANAMFTKPDSTGYKQGVSEPIYNSITPYGYDLSINELFKTIQGIGNGLSGQPRQPPDTTHIPMSNQMEREDAWKLYLGLGQDNNTFTESTYKPTRAKDNTATYYQFEDPLAVLTTLSKQKHAGRRMSRTIESIVNEIKDKGGPIHAIDVDDASLGAQWFGGSNPHVMGNYQLDQGEDEVGPYISYYDKWDLDTLPAKIIRVGKPFEIYGRIYYDPDTFNYISEEDILAKREAYNDVTSARK